MIYHIIDVEIHFSLSSVDYYGYLNHKVHMYYVLSFTHQKLLDITRSISKYSSCFCSEALVAPASVRLPVAIVAEAEGQGTQSQDGADHTRHLPGAQSEGVQGRHGGWVAELRISEHES